VTREGDGLRLAAPDGSTATLAPPFPMPGDVTDVAGLLASASGDRRCAALLVRRGGYACAVLDGGSVTASKVGSRYVQSRTAAGGWSQQRFARRREGQARELVQAAVETAARVLLPALGPTSWLVTGGDRPLVEAALAAPRLAALGRLPRGPHLAVGDPRSDVVRALPGLLRAVRIVLIEA